MAANRANKPRQSFGKLSQRSRDRIAAEGARFGLSRRQVRDRYNRGTYNPLSPNPAKQRPRNAAKYPPRELAGVSIERLREDALVNIERIVGDRFGFNSFNVEYALAHTEDREVLYRLIFATEAELEDWAELQPQKRVRDRRRLESQGMLWHDESGTVRSFYWYH